LIYLPNLGAEAFGKFILDKECLKSVEVNLCKINDVFKKKQIYKMLFDMAISGHCSGAFVAQVILSNLHARED